MNFRVYEDGKLVHDDVTIDHVIPRWQGGSNEDDNVVGACHRCNQRRNHRDQPPPDHRPRRVGPNQEYQRWLRIRAMHSDRYWHEYITWGRLRRVEGPRQYDQWLRTQAMHSDRYWHEYVNWRERDNDGI